MTPQEKDLVTQLLQRLKQAGGAPKDPEAEQLIRRAMAEQPDAPYYLVQTVLMQDMALAEAQRRISELESRAQSTAAPQRSFLGGSVPSAGPWARAQQPQAAQPVWGSQPAAPMQPHMQQPVSPMMQPSATSGFLRSAAATAAGIAGGALLFQGIQSMFGHGFGGAGFAQQPGISETVVNNYGTPDQPAQEQTAWNDPGAGSAWDQAPVDNSGVDQDVVADDWSGGDDSDLV
jgi:hypothetical protein